MNKMRYPLGLFIIGFIINFFFRYSFLFFPGLILSIVGIWVDLCLYVGLVLWGVDFILSLLHQLKLRRMINSITKNNPFINYQNQNLNNAQKTENGNGFTSNTSAPTIQNEAIKNNFVVDMSILVCQKCNYGDEMEKLNKYERVFYVTQTLEQEVNNGGFSQFFFNSSGALSNELVDSFTNIGALKTAEICKKALSVFKGNVPVDREKRQDMLEEANCEAILDELDNAFYKYEDNLTDLNYAYIMAHRNYFD